MAIIPDLVRVAGCKQHFHTGPRRFQLHHLLGVRCVAILIEVEARAAGFIGQPDDAMAGVGIDPGPRRLAAVLRGKIDGRSENGCAKQEAREENRHGIPPSGL